MQTDIRYLPDRTTKRFLGDDAQFVDLHMDWNSAKRWAEWWMQSQDLCMLSKDYSEMDEYVQQTLLL